MVSSSDLATRANMTELYSSIFLPASALALLTYYVIESLPLFIVARAILMFTLQARMPKVYMPSMTPHVEAAMVQIATCPIISFERDKYAKTC
jgi:hypothetical protein